MKEKRYSVKKAAKIIHYDERTIRGWCQNGKLPGAYRIGTARKWLIPESALSQLQTEHDVPKEPRAEQEPYKETPHTKRMHELAQKLAGKIDLPSLANSDLWDNLPADLEPGKYWLSLGMVEINEDKQISVNCHDVGANLAAPRLVRGLYSHFHTSGLSELAELVGDEGKLDSWAAAVGQHLEALMTFLKIITDKVTNRANVTFHDEVKPGLTRWFITTVWVDAIRRAGGHSWIKDSWYKSPEKVPDTSSWKLDCGTYRICIVRSRKTLRTYENWHKELRLCYARDPLAAEIAIEGQEMRNIAQEIRQRLKDFSDMESLPGRCELCHPTGQLRREQARK